MSVNRTCGETAEWLPVELVREEVAAAAYALGQVTFDGNPPDKAFKVMERLEALSQATFQRAEQFACPFGQRPGVPGDGTVDVEVQERHTEVWRCPVCHTVHRTDLPED